MRDEEGFRAVENKRVIAQAGETKHHLVHFGITVAAHRHDAFGHAVEHGGHFPGRIAVGKGIARPVVEQIAQQDHLIGRLRLDAFHEGFAPQRRPVDIRCHEKLHRSFLSSSSMLRARTSIAHAAALAQVTP